MTFWEILGAILIGPLKTLFEIIFSVACDIVGHPGAAIVVLSLAMNVILMPLYRRADAIQEAARDKENEMKPVVSHIKATFSGDERMMILQACYRENHYNPLSVLSGSLSLMLEIPFFLAAYQFLSSVEAFRGLGLGPIADLGKPDGLLTVGGFTVNVLPILMTLINVLSSALYLKGFPLKTKLQLYGMALFFLVFLYNRPSALVLYWTLNNTFSLFKTLYYKLPHNKKILAVVLGIGGGALIALGITWDRRVERLMMLLIGLVMQLPWALPLLKKLPLFSKKANREKPEVKPNTALFMAGGLLLSVLVGMLIPSNYIAASVQEYINPTYFYNPVWYVIRTLCISAGFFLVWFGVFYWLAKPKVKNLFATGIWILCVVMLVNYLFFGRNLGIISPDLAYTSEFYISRTEKLLNAAVIAAIAVVGFFLSKKLPKLLPSVVLVAAIAVAAIGGYNVHTIAKEAAATKVQLQNASDAMPNFNLSKNGKNVMVIMLDRGIGPFVPYIMEENPDLVKQFDGFTYYENTLSHGSATNFGSPGLYGGYEYTPTAMNQRTDKTLVEKHNEALKLMPAVFSEADYEVTVIDPPFANYNWITDISIYDDMPGVDAYLAEGRFNELQGIIDNLAVRERNFFFFSLMKALPSSLQESVYDKGAYHALPAAEKDDLKDVSWGFRSAYNVLSNMSTMTTVTEGSENTFMVMRSIITHEPEVLQEPDFVPSSFVDNSAYYPPEGKTITDGTDTRLLTNDTQISHYHSNMKALMLLGDWFDQLRKDGVYDNTRIIIVADHSQTLGIFDTDTDAGWNIGMYLPMLMVKDFDDTGFTTSDTLMTNADVPTLATKGLVENPVNPFTGQPISDAAKTESACQYVFLSGEWNISVNNGQQFLPAAWASVSGNVKDTSNWVFYPEPAVLPPDSDN